MSKLWPISDKATYLNNQSQVGNQRVKKVVSDSLELVDFAIRLVNSVFNLPNGEVMFCEEFK